MSHVFQLGLDMALLQLQFNVLCVLFTDIMLFELSFTFPIEGDLALFAEDAEVWQDPEWIFSLHIDVFDPG